MATTSRAFYNTEVTLHTHDAQVAMTRTFEHTRNSLFYTSIILKIVWDDESKIEVVDAYIDNLLAKMQKQLNDEIARLSALMDSQAIASIASYSDPTPYTVQIDSPRLTSYVRIIETLDNLIRLIDTVWLGAIINDRERRTESFKWRQLVIKLAGQIIGQQGRARHAARKAGKDEQVAAVAPVQEMNLDDELQEVVTGSESFDPETKLSSRKRTKAEQAA